MRIGLVTDTYLPDINGVVSSTVTLKEALEKNGHTVFVITNHAGSKTEYKDQILRLPGVKLKGLYGYKLSSPINMGATDYIEQMDLDILHLQTNFGVGIYGQMIAKSLNIPLVDTYHTMFTDYTHYINPRGFEGVDRVSKDAIKAASRAVCNNVQAVIAPSQKTKEALIEYGVIAPIYVVPTGLNFSQFSDVDPNDPRVAQIRARVTDDPEATVLIFLGRLAREKSLEIPIEAIAKSKDEHLHLAVVGGGPDEDWYKEQSEKLNAQDRVHFLGSAAPEEVGLYYAAADAFVSASLSETQGMTYLEAMAAGKMVFGRRDEVLEDLIDEGVTGYYFNTADELLEKIEQFRALPEEKKKENREACHGKVSPYTAESFAYAMERVYEQAMDDFSKTFEVEKIRFVDDYVFLTLSREASKEEIKMILPLDDFFDYKISLHTRLDSYMVRSYLDLQTYYWCMYRCKHRLYSRDMTRMQVEMYCIQKLKAPAAVAKEVAAELEESGRINDRQYAIEKADYYQSVGSSRSQIEQKLLRAGISFDLIHEACANLSDDQERSNARQLARRLARSLKTQSVRQSQQTIIHKLVSKGYSLDAAREAAEALDFEEDYNYNALNAAYAKASRLYAGKEEPQRTMKIRTYCLRQGFGREEVDDLMESRKEEDENQ